MAEKVSGEHVGVPCDEGPVAADVLGPQRVRALVGVDGGWDVPVHMNLTTGRTSDGALRATGGHQTPSGGNQEAIRRHQEAIRKPSGSQSVAIRRAIRVTISGHQEAIRRHQEAIRRPSVVHLRVHPCKLPEGIGTASRVGLPARTTHTVAHLPN